ncbi:DUF2158 domain-containing protein [Rouxiella silvae]|uniref:DUF2158 domain-containing protein n=1 Tax=Rouxiella silvae TaxID=1646373 RepID=UPI000A111E38
MTVQFNVGDVVVLNSGGPKMTVVNIRGNVIHVVWFFDNTVMNSEFLSDTLKAHRSS